MLKGHQSWVFQLKPVIISSSAVGGPFEAQGVLAEDFDILHEDIWLGQDSYEKAEKKLLEQACEKNNSKKSWTEKRRYSIFSKWRFDESNYSKFFTAWYSWAPFLGIFGACSSAIQGLALGCLLIDSKAAEYVLAGASSHNASAEKQFRYPTEYGSQKPPTAQWTVTGAGTGLVVKSREGPHVTSATIGRVIDMGLSDPFNMGAAMAPAAVDTIQAHFRDLNIDPSYYDIIATGDLGKVGHKIACDFIN